jgi:hypothetical protein
VKRHTDAAGRVVFEGGPSVYNATIWARLDEGIGADIGVPLTAGVHKVRLDFNAGTIDMRLVDGVKPLDAAIAFRRVVAREYQMNLFFGRSGTPRYLPADDYDVEVVKNGEERGQWLTRIHIVAGETIKGEWDVSKPVELRRE